MALSRGVVGRLWQQRWRGRGRRERRLSGLDVVPGRDRRHVVDPIGTEHEREGEQLPFERRHEQLLGQLHAAHDGDDLHGSHEHVRDGVHGHFDQRACEYCQFQLQPIHDGLIALDERVDELLGLEPLDRVIAHDGVVHGVGDSHGDLDRIDGRVLLVGDDGVELQRLDGVIEQLVRGVIVDDGGVHRVELVVGFVRPDHLHRHRRHLRRAERDALQLPDRRRLPRCERSGRVRHECRERDPGV
jgi:hypothetical protein